MELSLSATKIAAAPAPETSGGSEGIAARVGASTGWTGERIANVVPKPSSL